jgi:hypothetical protein
MKIDINDDDRALTRLRDILDAYGGDPDRWPDADRAPALALLARSADARRLCDEALRLDAALDLLPAAAPSADLEERIVAAARHTPQAAPLPPGIASLDEARRRRDAGGAPRRRLLLAAALPLAAAAAFALWIARADHTRPQQVAAAHGTTASGAVDTSEAELLAALGSYRTPDDALLELSGLDDVYDADPWHGCSEGDLGCVKKDTLPLEPISQGAENEVRILS